MKLNELLNKKVDYEVVRAGKYQFVTSAKIGDREIRFSAEENGSKKENEWDVAFVELKTSIDDTGKEHRRQTFDTTGSGNELEVFSMVKDSMLEFVERYKPNTISFTADMDAGKKDNLARVKVYEKLFNRFKIPGYKIDKIERPQHKYFDFVISKVGE